ncbi:flagellar assembly protein FliH [Aliiglaciecola sp. LCG003]|uniref:flagellar assembly protein FliH n=1 Tax=Aliiglaciecola sp. LCG003 TaxID=3053655 RepID=UPI0025743C31|nr:flagellar assembly protein FliH [Aliiglaciecola sp. LCG003]WJG10609.1 flagellar assembly protein FliH [Aliiglaciecola sp. LCG003]
MSIEGVNDQDLSDEEISAWELPYIEASTPDDDTKTNAFNRRSNWKYEPPEPEQEILPPTAEELAQIREAAYQEGFEQGKQEGHEKGLEEGLQQGLEEGKEKGYTEGHEQGLSAGEEELKQHIESLSGVLEHLHEPTASVDQQLQSELVKLAVSLAKAVIRVEVNTSTEVISHALAEGLKVLPIQESSYQILMNPEDIALIKQNFDQQHIDKNNWIFIDAPNMSRGGCDISTQNNAVDVSIERRIKDVLDRFLLEQGLQDIEAD